MEFRWVTLIALWTLFSGPVFGVPSARRSGDAVSAAPVAKVVVPRR